MQKLCRSALSLCTYLACLVCASSIAHGQQTGFSYLGAIGSSGTGLGQFSIPSGITLDAVGNTWVADSGNCRVLKFNPAKEFVGAIGAGFESCNPPGNSVPIKVPYDVVVDSSGAVYVSEIANNGHTVKKFSAAGDLLLTIGSFGSGDAQFNKPTSMILDQDGNLLVVDSGNRRVQKFSTAGAFLSRFDTQVSGEASLSEPIGIGVLSNGDIVVSDNGVDAVKIFTSSGEFRMKFGGSGTADGQFLSPAGVAVDAADNIIVTDDQRAIVQQFAKDGTFLTNLGSSGTGTGQFVTPLDVAIDQLGTVYITEGTNDRIEVYGLPFITATSTSGKGSGVIVSSDGLIRCGTDCSQRYDASKKVSLEALASTGSYFNAWGGTYCSGSSSTCSFTPLAATAETASFSLFPQLSLTDKPPRKSKSKDATFRFRMGCEGATFQCKLDSKSFSACTSPKSYSKLKKGSHTFTVRALKNGGKSEAKTFSWRIKKK